MYESERIISSDWNFLSTFDAESKDFKSTPETRMFNTPYCLSEDIYMKIFTLVNLLQRHRRTY